MPRHNMVPKTIHGEYATHSEFLAAICEGLDRKPEGARVVDLIVTLGPEWDDARGRKLLATTLSNMAQRGTVRLVGNERGVYQTTAMSRRNGVTRFDEDEKSIMAVIRQHGGFCYYRDIMEAHGVRVKGPDAEANAQDSVHQRLLHVMRNSDKLRQDFAQRGVWHLPWKEIATLPIRGKWISMISKVTYQELIGDEAWNSIDHLKRDFAWWAWREFQFEQVGAAFRQVRKTFRRTREYGEEFTIADLLEQAPKVKAAMLEHKKTAAGEINNIRYDWKDRTEVAIEQMREEADGVSNALIERIDAYRAEREEEYETRILEWMYKRFEEGRVGAHMYAPLSLYTSVAEFFGVDAAALSRGMVFAWVDEKFRMRAPTNQGKNGDVLGASIIAKQNWSRQEQEAGEEEAIDLGTTTDLL